MTIERYSGYQELREASAYPALLAFLEAESRTGFFQTPEFIGFIEPVAGFTPVLYAALDATGRVTGSLLAVYQRDGGVVRSWMSRRLLVQGGPLGDEASADALIATMLEDAEGKAIYAEFRNAFSTEHLRDLFDRHGFTFVPHLNFLLDVEGEEEAMKTLSSTRRREIRGSLAAGATYGLAESDTEVEAFYGILAALYREKVRKPLPTLELFLRLHRSPVGRVFVVRHGGRVIGGSAGPVHKDRVIYYWYACGDNSIKGVHASVLATWAPIEHAAREGIPLLDFMGAGKPGQGYGVHDFKARFGGSEVSHGRYEKVLNRPLYRLGVTGLKVYGQITGLLRRKR